MSGSGSLNYGQMMNRALRRMMAEVLGIVAERGLPGDHHFYITFETGHPGVDIPDWLRERYPDEMMIVMQDWFADLVVTQDRFSVTLNFSDQPQTLVVPFAAVRTFIDPSVKFGLKFDAHDPEDLIRDLEPPEDDEDDPEPVAPERDRDGPGGAQIVSLDKFRKP